MKLGPTKDTEIVMSKPQVVGRIPPKAYYAMHDFKII